MAESDRPDDPNAVDDTADRPIEADRDIPSVARRSTTQTGLIVAFLLVCLVAVGALVWNALQGEDPATLADDEAEEFQIRQPASGAPFIKPEKPEEPESPPAKKEPEKVERPARDAYNEQLQRDLQQSALRLAEEQAKRQRERMRSPLIVFDARRKSTSDTPTPTNDAEPATVFPGGSGTSDDNPNQAFLERTSTRGVDTRHATKLENIGMLVPQGTLIGGILETAIQSDLPGQVRAVVSKDVYAMDQSRVLIPRGSRLIGRYRSGLVRGQTRVFVVWERLLRSDGVSIQVGSAGTDQLGRAGLAGDVDTHFFERFGASILLSIIDGAIAGAVEAAGDSGSTNVAIDGGNNFSKSAEIALQNSINIPPTIHVDQGTRINVFVGRDLDFSAALQ